MMYKLIFDYKGLFKLFYDICNPNVYKYFPYKDNSICVLTKPVNSCYSVKLLSEYHNRLEIEKIKFEDWINWFNSIDKEKFEKDNEIKFVDFFMQSF